MDFTVEKIAFARVVKDAVRAASSKPIQPVLGCIQIEAIGGNITCTATNMDFWISADVPGDAIHNLSKTGRVCVPAKLLSDVVSKLPSEDGIPVSVILKKDKLIISCGTAKFQLGILDDEFPKREDIGGQSATLKADVLAVALDSVAFCAHAADPGILGAINLTNEGGHLCAVACNGAFLGRFERACAGGDNFAALLPVKAAETIATIIAASEEEILIWADKAWLHVQGSTHWLSARLIAGQAPDYKKLIPTDNSISAGIQVKPFLDALNRLSSVSDSRIGACRLKFNGETKLELFSKSDGVGDGCDACQVDFYEGKPLEINFSLPYLKTIVGALDTDGAWFEMSESLKPVVISESRGDASAKYMLMPLQVG